ncbi:hypothetical protein [Vibrio phage vB_VpaS_AL-2]|nr:hypothetical protein [Vibrio phage vB_VpaS_AL-2]
MSHNTGSDTRCNRNTWSPHLNSHFRGCYGVLTSDRCSCTGNINKAAHRGLQGF